MNWLAIGLLAVTLALVWSNIFQNSFHYDDFSTIVNNRFVHEPGRYWQFFRDPRSFSAISEDASWRPLLSAFWTLDYWAARGANPQIFLIDSFVWFIVQLIFVYVVFRLIPGGSHLSALFGTALVGLHPVSAETANYISQRGGILAALGIAMGMAAWIFFPRMLPRRIDLGAPQVPKSDWDAWRLKTQPKLDTAWTAFLKAPLAFYLIPVVPALLTSPVSASFALILLAYVIVLDPDRSPRHVIPAGIVCGLLWIVPEALTWQSASQVRPPAILYWATQPLVAVRYLFTFVWPGRLAIDSGLQAVDSVFSPLALAGYAGLGMLVALAVAASRSSAWRGAGFGLWWFLVALLPDALAPQRFVEATPRMYVAMIGLAFAVTRAAAVALERVRRSEKNKLPATIATAAAGLLLLGGLGWSTSQRNAAWESEETIWHDAVEKYPVNGRALVHYAEALTANGADLTTAYGMMQRAATLSPHDPSIEIELARTASRLGLLREAEGHYQRVIRIQPGWADGYGLYSQWLLGQFREQEAVDNAHKAMSLRSDQADARHTLMDAYVQHHDWENAMRVARETISLYPDDTGAVRAINVSSAALNEVKQLETQAPGRGRDGYLALSVTYFKNGRYEDSVKAAREALKIDPNSAESWSNLAAALHSLGRIDESVEASKETVRLNPNLPFAKSNLEYALAEQADQHKQKPDRQ